MRLNIFAAFAALLLVAAATAAEARPVRADHSADAHASSQRRAYKSRHVYRSEAKERRVYRKKAHAERTYRSKHKAAHRSHKVRRAAQRTHTPTRAERVAASYSGGSHNAGPRPRAWCGWWMRTQRGGGAHLNVAWNWSKWGRPSGPQVGAVVVWRHHVGEIVGRAANGQWIVRSGNDSGTVRTRARSVAGAVFRMG